MYKAIVFAGTTEGYALCRFLARNQVRVCACTATEYGSRALSEDSYLTVRTGRLSREEMESMFWKEQPVLVLDATHPYAVEATQNIRQACENTGVSYLRILREQEHADKSGVYVENTAQAATFLKTTTGNVLLTTGSKELSAFTAVPGYEKRLFARVLSLPSVAAQCKELGFEGRNLICMQGPFSKELNMAMLRQYDCHYLVTKDSGSAGGFAQKLEACEECGVIPVIIGRPVQEEGVSLTECRRLLAQRFGFEQNPRVCLVGIGMGSRETLTLEAKKALEEADLVIGARRMLDAVCPGHKERLCEYRHEVIAEYIRTHREYEQIAVALSGDVGFYSGARKLLELLPAPAEVICGISSVSYFMGKIGLSWEDAVLASAHGRDCNLVGLIHRHPKVFSILGTETGVGELAERLTAYGMGNVLLYVGENLSYPKERIFAKTARELAGYTGDALSVVCAWNPDFCESNATHGIGDGAFIRGKAPMTKEEVRCVSLAKLGLKENSICYDVGAGTGSVSVEMALRAFKGRVYAIEKKEEAIALLKENKKKFAADNLEIIAGTAPEALKDLPAPTHGFIGGSSGNLKEILRLLFEKNPGITIVLNCITLETVSEALESLKEYPFAKSEIVQLCVSRAKNVGSYHMMMGENPIYMITIHSKEREQP